MISLDTNILFPAVVAESAEHTNAADFVDSLTSHGDVVISEKLRRDPAVEALLAEKLVQITKFATSIKGFDEHFNLYRFMP